MAVRFYDKVHVRAATTPVTTISKTQLASGWDLLPGQVRMTQETTLQDEPDVTTPMGDGTDEVGSIASNAELQLVNWLPESLATIRSALINQKVDLLIYDSKQGNLGWAIFGIQIFPAPEIGSNKEQIIKLTGKVRYASDSAPALNPVTLS